MMPEPTQVAIRNVAGSLSIDGETPTENNSIPGRPEWLKKPARDADAGDASERWSVLWLTDRDVRICLVLGTILLVLLAVDWGRRSDWGRREIEIDRLAKADHVYRIDLNTANWVEIAQLEGIGPALAHRIVEDRQRQGPFRTVEELDRVKGIGPKTLERLRPYVRVEFGPRRRRWVGQSL